MEFLMNFNIGRLLHRLKIFYCVLEQKFLAVFPGVGQLHKVGAVLLGHFHENLKIFIADLDAVVIEDSGNEKITDWEEYFEMKNNTYANSCKTNQK